MPAWATGRRNRWPRPRRRRLGTLLLLAVGLVAIVVYAASPDAPTGANGAPIAGKADRIVDGDTLDLAGQRIRLVGLDAPEREQSCTAADGGSWDCGAAATAALRKLVGAAELNCNAAGADRYGRTLATCYAAGTNLAEALVRDGHAVSSGAYAAAEAEARAAHRGLWAGSFVAPADWRRDAGLDAAGTGGNPSRFERFLRWLLEVLTG